MSKRPLKMTMRHPNQTKLGLSKNYFANDVPVSVVDVEYHPVVTTHGFGHIYVASVVLVLI